MRVKFNNNNNVKCNEYNIHLMSNILYSIYSIIV